MFNLVRCYYSNMYCVIFPNSDVQNRLQASEHYSLRYTETLVVECAYLRREVSKLKHQNENFEQRLKMLEQYVK